MFKLIGILVGYYFFGLFGALIGFFVGQVIDRSRDYGVGAINPMSQALRQAVFMETAFVSLGTLAKADGRVSEAEIAHTEAFMAKLGLTAEHRQQAIAWFKQGADPEFDLAPRYQRFMAVCGQTHQLRQMLLVLLISMALTDGEVHAAEQQLLERIAQWLRFDAQEFRQLLAMVAYQAKFAQDQPSHEETQADAYQALGVTPQNTDQEIKRAYRKLISQYHPDKLMGQGLPPDMIAMATEKAKEIQVAYDLIQKTRAAAA